MTGGSMCECGCAEGMSPEFTFPGPEGITYALALYPGCRECSNPAGIVLYALGTAELADEDSDYGPPDWREEIRWVTGRDGTREVSIPTIRPDDFDAILKENDLEEVGIDDAYTTLAHKAFNEFRDLQEAAIKTESSRESRTKEP